MSYCTIDPKRAGETLAQTIRDHLEAGRYVLLDGAGHTVRLVGANRRGTTTVGRTIAGLHVVIDPTDVVRIERA